MVRTKHTDQWNRIESPEINSCPYNQLIFDKGGRNIQCGKGSIFNQWCWGYWTVHTKKLDHLLTQNKRMNSQWIKDLNIRLETIKILEENACNKNSDISVAIFFSDISSWARATKEKISK